MVEDEFNYLGRTITRDGQSKDDIKTCKNDITYK